MKKKLINLLLFASGAAIGSLVTWKVVKTKYERILQEEIDSVKETWERLNSDKSDVNNVDQDDTESEDVEDLDEDEFDPEDEEMIDYTRLASRYGSSSDKEEEGGGDEVLSSIDGPYVIEPTEYGNGNYDHKLYCLTYYFDGILANDWWETFDIEDTIGEDALNHFGDYVDDVVHVRNERLGADYEVVKDPRNYSDVIASDPLKYAYAN
jgi:hypothetical protein